MQITIDIKESALDKIMYLLNNLKSDVTILKQDNSTHLDVTALDESEADSKIIMKAREERKKNPQDYGTISDIAWN